VNTIAAPNRPAPIADFLLPRSKLRRAPLTAAVAILALFAAGCGDQSRGGQVPGNTLTIYSSLPLQGPHAAQAQAIINAEKLALNEAGGKSGSFKINFASIDDATAGIGAKSGWNPGRTADNATKASEDSGTIAYVGEFDSGASAVSIPITNEAGFVQVSPAASAVGLTKLVPGADKGEPDKYYPSGDRNFVRVVPADDVQASAAVAWAKQLGARKVVTIDDKGVTGESLVAQFEASARDAGMAVERKSMDPRASDYRDFVKQVAKARPDLVYFGGGVESNAKQLWRDLAPAVPGARLMGSARLISPDFYRGLRSVGERTFLVSATQDPSQLPAAGRRFSSDYRHRFGQLPDPYAAYGFTSMLLLLDAIDRAGDRAGQRGEIISKVLDTRNFQSPIGAFAIDDNGDTSLDKVAGYRVRNGALEFVKALRGRARG
jgi:branched-chain amino acid transport system substrate-binding protein